MEEVADDDKTDHQYSCQILLAMLLPSNFENSHAI